MNDLNNKKSAVNEKPSINISGSNKNKYALIIFIAIVAAILVQYLFPHDNHKTELPQENIQTAESANVALNLGNNTPQIPEMRTLPIQQIHVPSVLPPPNLISDEQTIQDEQQRLKSPSLVYSAPGVTTANVNAQTTSTNPSGNPNQAFADQAANMQVINVSAKKQINTDNKILQGKIIPAILETAINSDLPGMVRAEVNEDVYGDSGNKVLLPRGTRLIGLYNSTLAVGQTRVMIVWTRAITPQYIDIALGSPGTDQLGEAGSTGVVDTHFWQIFGTSALLSVLGVAASSVNTSNSNNEIGAYGNPYQAAVSQGALNTSNALLQNRVNIQPTIHIAQGTAIQVFVARDLDFSNI